MASAQSAALNCMLINWKIDWALKTRKHLGISDMVCNMQCFPLKMWGDDDGSRITTAGITIKCIIELANSAYLLCLDIGIPKRSKHLPWDVEVSLLGLIALLAVKSCRCDNGSNLIVSAFFTELTAFEGRDVHAPTHIHNPHRLIGKNPQWERSGIVLRVEKLAEFYKSIEGRTPEQTLTFRYNTTGITIVALICYAHIAAAQMGGA